jgi:hypothetical protein
LNYRVNQIELQQQESFLTNKALLPDKGKQGFLREKTGQNLAVSLIMSNFVAYCAGTRR